MASVCQKGGRSTQRNALALPSNPSLMLSSPSRLETAGGAAGERRSLRGWQWLCYVSWREVRTLTAGKGSREAACYFCSKLRITLQKDHSLQAAAGLMQPRPRS